MFSPVGVIPCQPCPKNTFSGPPKLGGYRTCDACPEGTFTAGIGATGPSMCKCNNLVVIYFNISLKILFVLDPCAPGQYSWTGLQPCSSCPPNFYQPSPGQLRCIECPNNTYSEKPAANSTEDCRPGINNKTIKTFIFH